MIESKIVEITVKLALTETPDDGVNEECQWLTVNGAAHKIDCWGVCKVTLGSFTLTTHKDRGLIYIDCYYCDDVYEGSDEQWKRLLWGKENEKEMTFVMCAWHMGIPSDCH
jgi:hypothetical protein